MKVAVFGSSVDPGFIPVLQKFFHFFKSRKIRVDLYKPFYLFLTNDLGYTPYCTGFFHSHTDFDTATDFIFSVGGDGTFLKSVQCIQNYEIPIVGVNSGRLGFLADISQEEVIGALTNIAGNKFHVIERTMIQVELSGGSALDYNYALNEATVLKADTSSMISIKAYINGEILNNFWADGLIIATPTGSTAYSLSVGGPILTPGSENFVITPIAPHNLTVRPIVVPDDNELVLKVTGRGTHFLASLDSRSVSVEFSTSVKVKKAASRLKTIVLDGHSFYGTLRNKLLWGIDKRN